MKKCGAIAASSTRLYMMRTPTQRPAKRAMSREGRREDERRGFSSRIAFPGDAGEKGPRSGRTSSWEMEVSHWLEEYPGKSTR